MAIRDYSTEPNMNTTISGINIAEGCAPSGINNAIRQLMADVKAEQAAKDAEQAAKDAEQAAKDAEQDAAISSKVSTVNGLTPDYNGNVDVGGMPLGTLFPYTGKDVPAGTLRADGATYTNMKASFPDFYEWVVASGLTVPLGSYALVEGSCGYYGLDESTGTVRMPTLAAGVFGADAASKYGQAVEAGLPNITGNTYTIPYYKNMVATGALYIAGAATGQYGSNLDTACVALSFDASRSNPIYGRSDTVTPSHVKYPWVIVVYNAAVAPSVAQAGEFVEMLDKLA
ncbi:MAG: cell envelope integrity protein TolA, partial [Akkermansia sp.]|nr:cell envelope integrity protein TolA [Akkermansia sp.]